MKTLTLWSTRNLAGALLLLLATQLSAQDKVRYDASPGSKVKIEGTSTIHDWTMEGSIIGGTFEIEKEFQSDLSLKSVPCLNGKGCPAVKASITVRTLKSGKETMDGIMQDAMKAKEHPRIEYKLTAMKPKGDVPASGTPVKFDAKGDLSIAGVTKPIDLEVTMERLEGNKIRFKGATPDIKSPTAMKMTDYGIKPPAPSLALGLIKTGDEIKVSFEWMLALKQDAAK
ncbi:MAG: YceI family protein [Verrucomicrobia bacterium]|nr:YceI family protein [Verrucomicrobiota bacterium]